ncbi:MAG: hypothetical protein PUB94_01350 [Oscillospiraceae bacterium]|nr:hypothetical protein [Oscillospiraceae bacterium]
MNNLRYKLASFMQGRNGADQLTVLTLAGYVVLAVIRAFLRRNRTAYYIFGALMLLFAAYALFRILSGNLPQRQRENEVFRRMWLKVRPKFILFKDRIRDIRTKRYRTCPGCKNVLRLPYSRGKHTVRCPRCGKVFSVHII